MSLGPISGLWLGLLFVCMSVANASSEFYPRATGSVMYSDNLNRASTLEEPFADFVFQVIPALAATQTGSRWSSDILASLQFLKYARATEADDVFLNLNALPCHHTTLPCPYSHHIIIPKHVLLYHHHSYHCQAPFTIRCVHHSLPI
jgi:hypothetical protein